MEQVGKLVTCLNNLSIILEEADLLKSLSDNSPPSDNSPLDQVQSRMYDVRNAVR